MKIILVSKCSLDIEQYVEFEMSVLISPSKSLISSRLVTNGDSEPIYTSVGLPASSVLTLSKAMSLSVSIIKSLQSLQGRYTYKV